MIEAESEWDGDSNASDPESMSADLNDFDFTPTENVNVKNPFVYLSEMMSVTSTVTLKQRSGWCRSKPFRDYFFCKLR